jgi:hypothetical protein
MIRYTEIFISTNEDKATVLGASDGDEIGAGLYVGFGFDPFKINHPISLRRISLITIPNQAPMGVVALIDINGDGLPDKVFGKGRAFFLDLAKPNGVFGAATIHIRHK